MDSDKTKTPFQKQVEKFASVIENDLQKEDEYEKVGTFKGFCLECKGSFIHPLLSDFCYGKFIARGPNNTTFAFLNAIDNVVWNLISELVHKNIEAEKLQEREESECIQWVIGKCIDKLNDQELSIVIGPVCPFCLSKNISYGDDIRIGIIDLPKVTFNKFMSYDMSTKEELIIDLCLKCLNK